MSCLLPDKALLYQEPIEHELTKHSYVLAPWLTFPVK